MDEPTSPPSGMCQCGCGEPAPVATRNGGGYLKGQPKRFLKGHGSKAHLWPEGTPAAAAARRTVFVKTGERFGRGVVVDPEVRLPRRDNPGRLGYRAVRLLCDCGNEYVCQIAGLTAGNTQSCGCLRLERQTGRPVGPTAIGEHGRPTKNIPQGDAPPCACGCGAPVAWNRPKSRWNRYATGHYRRPASYKDAEWLRREYVDKGRTLKEIAEGCGVNRTVIRRYMRRFGIDTRNASDAHAGRQAGPLNPAWKGGVADWAYAPEWKSLARKIRARDQWTCQDCGEQRKRWGTALHVHHIDCNKLNNDPSNLISLCDKCHRERHRLLARGAA